MKPEIAPHILQQTLTERFGTFSLHALHEGDDSLSFRIETDSGEFVLRLNEDRFAFDKDKWAAQTVTAVPVPQILDIFELSGAWACLSTYIPGPPFQLAPEADLPGLVPAVAEALIAIGQTDISGTTGYGLIDATGNGTLKSWRDFLRQPLDAWQDTATDPVVTEALTVIDQLSAHVPEHRHLVHSDFGGGNVLVSRNTVLGVIDWSESRYGDPLYDVANVHFWCPWLTCLDHLAPVLDDLVRPDPELLRLYQLHIGLANIRDYHRANDPRSLTWVQNRTTEILCAG